jgi:hypothetical protein
MVPIFGLFLASLCVIHVVRFFPAHWHGYLTQALLQRNEIERFKKIDSKRGGRGFV